MEITPDNIIYWQWNVIKLNATIIYTWVVMVLLVGVSWLTTRNLRTDEHLSKTQNMMEVVVSFILKQIRSISHEKAERYMPFIGTLFLFIVTSNVLAVVPGFNPPTGSLTTTSALAICVFVAVPVFGIFEQGVVGYLKHYISPSPFMLPFNVIGEISRTLALAVRLFGNIMSSNMIAAILLSIAPIIFPVLMHVLGMITGVIQAYIFAILAIVYIASASQVKEQTQQNSNES